jgi:hypothetical protein
VEGVHAEVAQAAVLAVEGGLPLPVDRLPRVEVAGVEEEGAHLEDAAEAPLGDPARDPLAAGVEGELGGAADEQIRPLGDRGVDGLVRGQVDPERLLAEEVLAGLEAGDVEVLVQVMGDGAVDRLHRVVGQELAVVGDEPRTGLEALVPGQDLGVRVADDRQLGPDAERGEVHPARRRARELASHQPAADEPEADGALLRHAPRRA